MNDELYFSAPVLAVLAEYRALTPAEQRQFKTAIRPPSQAFGLLARSWRARKRNERIHQLLGYWYQCGDRPAKVDWVQVRKVVDPEHLVTLASLRRSFRRWLQSRTVERLSAVPIADALARLPLLPAE